MPILSSSDYPQVRAAIDISITAAVLSNDIIAMPIFQGAGERDVLERDPDAATREDAELEHVKAAAVYFTAARLAPVVPAISSERFGDQQSYQRLALNAKERAAELRRMAADELAVYLDPPSSGPEVPFLITTLEGRRGL